MLTACSRWAIWELPRRAIAYVLLVDVLAALALVVALRVAPWRPADLALFLVLLACALVSVEGSRRLGSPETRRDRPYKDMLSTWMLPAAILLPPVYAMLIPLPVYLLVQLRVTRILPVKRVFNGASVALAGLLANAARSAVAGSWDPPTGQLLASGRGLAGAVLAAAVYSAVSAVLVAGVLRRANPAMSRRSAFGGWPLQATEAAELCLGIAVALVGSGHPLLAVLVLPPMLLLQSTLLHEELLHAARTDSKTGLADPRHWREVAERELVRARRGDQAVTVLLVDIDRFKSVNDRYGHLVGDQALVAVADQLRATVRPRDLVGRFGGEEFVLLLTDATPAAGAATAERVRAAIEQHVRLPARGGTPLKITVSVGVAALGHAALDLAGLLAAADRACFAAKAAGRNRVCIAPAGPQDAVLCPPPEADLTDAVLLDKRS